MANSIQTENPVILRERAPNEVRRITISDALVDTGATALSLPSRLIQQLGLSQQSERQIITSSGTDQAAMHTAVRLSIQGRTYAVDVIEVPDDVPTLIGQIPQELLTLSSTQLADG